MVKAKLASCLDITLGALYPTQPFSPQESLGIPQRLIPLDLFMLSHIYPPW